MSTQILNAETYSGAEAVRGDAATMSYGGVIAKSLFLLVLTVICAVVGWDLAADAVPQSGMWFFLGYILLIALTFAAAGNPKIALPAGVLYALLMGTWMGAISRVYEDYYEGIVGAAIGVTLMVFLATLLLYATRVIRVTARFAAVMTIALCGILFLYLFGWLLSIFGADLNFLNEPTPTGIAIQIAIAVIAALSLTLDFSFIETGVEQGAPKDYEWYTAFGLQTTLVWLYLEILKLLALLANR
ncbi:MAG: Bax inhibitor-1/YccA family protein [Solirubrobacterales bacterium]